MMAGEYEAMTVPQRKATTAVDVALMQLNAALDWAKGQGLTIVVRFDQEHSIWTCDTKIADDH